MVRTIHVSIHRDNGACYGHGPALMGVCEDDGRQNGVLPIGYARVAIDNDGIAPAPQGIEACFNGKNHVLTRQLDVTSRR